MLPPRRKPQRSGITRAARREWPRHRNFLRSHHCVVTGCLAEPIEVSHIRTAANAGTGIKPHDAFAVPMCGGPAGHHAEYHRIGHASFERKYAVDLKAAATVFAQRSTDVAMRESLKLQHARPGMPTARAEP